jgi:glycine dehydrogenase subunit 1
MAYLPNTAQEQAEMLQDLERSRLDDLFRQVPDRLKLRTLSLPEALSEIELVQYFGELGQLNELVPPALNFLGGGASRRFSPAIVNAIISRPDSYSAYTPYQAEGLRPDLHGDRKRPRHRQPVGRLDEVARTGRRTSAGAPCGTRD